MDELLPSPLCKFFKYVSLSLLLVSAAAALAKISLIEGMIRISHVGLQKITLIIHRIVVVNTGEGCWKNINLTVSNIIKSHHH